MENKLLKEFIFNTFDSDTIMAADTLNDYEKDIDLFQALTENSVKKENESKKELENSK